MRYVTDPFRWHGMTIVMLKRLIADRMQMGNHLAAATQN